MENGFIGFLIGVAFAAFFTIFILLPISNVWAHENNIIVSKNNNSLICHVKKEYPKTNCKLIAEAIGPKQNKLIIKDK